ncbi:MAG: Uma2 family endonuclease [Planctomycetota bacterium]
MAIRLELNSSLAPPLPLRRFTVAQYHQLGDLGLLMPEDNVELLEGWIVEKMNQRPIHGFIVGLVAEILHRKVSAGSILRCQLPITTERSEPEPDIAVVRGAHADYRERHPGGSDCQLVIEVADTSLEKDRSKAAIYREAGVAKYWIINVNEKVLEKYDFSKADSEPEFYPCSSTIETEIGDSVIALDLKQLFS